MLLQLLDNSAIGHISTIGYINYFSNVTVTKINSLPTKTCWFIQELLGHTIHATTKNLAVKLDEPHLGIHHQKQKRIPVPNWLGVTSGLFVTLKKIAKRFIYVTVKMIIII